MKKILLVLALIVALANPLEAGNFYMGTKANITREEIILSLTEIVRLFDEHAKAVGGAGFLYGVKSEIKTLFTDSHREMLENYVLRTPEDMLYASGISEKDPALGKVFVEYCGMMPTVYDTRKRCREKILRCVKAMFPEKNDAFYEDTMTKIQKRAGVTWL